MLDPTELRSAGVAAQPLAFEAFFRDEYPRLARACYLLTGEAAEAEDLAQEAMARAYERWDRVGAMDSPAGYLYQTAFNLNRKRVRHLAMAARRRIAALPPRDPAELAEAASDVLRALSAVPPDQREALILVGWMEMSAVEAAAVLRIAPTSVRGRVHRARITLRELFDEGDDDA